MESLDLIDLKTRKHSPRIAIHMALALPSGLATGAASRRRVPRVWRWWMTIAAMAMASTAVAAIVVSVLRRVL